jgi:hypothetical protein
MLKRNFSSFVSLMKYMPIFELTKISTISKTSYVLSSFIKGRPTPAMKPKVMHMLDPNARLSVGNCSYVISWSTLKSTAKATLVRRVTVYSHYVLPGNIMRKKNEKATKELAINMVTFLLKYLRTTLAKRVASSSVTAIKPKLMKLSPFNFSKNSD